MSSPRNVKDIPDSDIPRGEDLGDLTGVQVPETATIEGCDIDSKELHHYRRVNIVELLHSLDICATVSTWSWTVRLTFTEIVPPVKHTNIEITRN